MIMFKLRLEIIIVVLTICLPKIVIAQESNISKKYTHTIRPHPTSVYRTYDLTLNSDNTFLLRKYYEEFCYNYTDTIKGKWALKDRKLDFIEINYPNQIKSAKVDTIAKDYILIVEKDYKKREIIKTEIYLTMLDSNFQTIKIVNPSKVSLVEDDIEYKKFLLQLKNISATKEELDLVFKEEYIKRDLVVYCEIPKEAFMIVYHGKLYHKPSKSTFIEKGINLNIKESANYFTIFEIPHVLNSSLKFQLTDKGSLKSIKPVDSDIGRNKEHEYGKTPNE